ncbi:methyl-accepting chemotaxis protein [Pseudocolwellia sp. HL-MZ19]|uniref:methyl-accepting chemotaxis protein n=1 Tax=unclassified Pseudocolwellia TaxID=2848178 RepID=UPI003CEDA79A
MFTNLSFKRKICFLLLLPLISFLWMSVVSVNNYFTLKNEMEKLTQLTELSVVYSSLVHELQKERGLTAGFIGSNGKSFKTQLAAQRKLTNSEQDKQQSFWQKNDETTKVIVELHNSINKQLNQLSTIRRSIDAKTVSLNAALSYYTSLNAKLLSVSKVISLLSTEANITKEMIAYYNFLQGKERAGIERAVLSNVFSIDSISSPLLVRTINLISEQNTYFQNFKDLSTTENTQFYSQAMQKPAAIEVERLRQVVIKKSAEGEFGIDESYWFEQATGRIKQLKEVENTLGTSLIALTHEIRSDANQSLILSIVSVLIISLLVILISLAVINDLNNRIKDLLSVLGKVREENDLTVRAQYNDKSELGTISNVLNLTLEKFSNTLSEISGSSISLASEAEETAQTCEYSFKNIEEQQAEIALVATSIEELSVTVKEVAMNTKSAVDAAKDADKGANAGLDIVKISYRSIEALAEDISDLSVKITSLHESSLNITNIVDVIKSVAEQTNLLALNAAIEAARAGEQGRGFAVVADEVRTLAQRTQQSTNEIESFISELQGNANLAFGVIENSQSKANDAVVNSKNVEQVLSNITQSVNHIFSLTEQVATAAEQQAVVTQDVAKSVVNIEDASLGSVTGAKQIATTAQHQAQLAASLQDTVNSFKVG